MENTDIIVIFGSDSRFEYIGAYLKEKGFEVCDFDKGISTSLKTEGRNPVVFVLPLPFSRDNIRLNASDEESRLTFDGLYSIIKNGDTIIGGMLTDSFKNAVCSLGAACFDYYDEKMIEDNATLTARAVKMLFEELEIDFKGKKIAVTGFGRVAKVLCEVLESENANFTVTARSDMAQMQAGSRNWQFVKFESFTDELPFFDIIINTVPALIFDEGKLRQIRGDAIFFDLASAPYGVSDKLAKEYKLRLIRALSLPGRYLPDEAGKLIGRRIELILKGGS